MELLLNLVFLEAGVPVPEIDVVPLLSFFCPDGRLSLGNFYSKM